MAQPMRARKRPAPVAPVAARGAGTRNAAGYASARSCRTTPGRRLDIAAVQRPICPGVLLGLPFDPLLALAFAIAAALYASVGHAGASAYIAIMALYGVAPDPMRPVALALNVVVATFGTARFLRAGLFRWRVLWPFLLGAVPMAFLGGAVTLPADIFKRLVGAILLLASARLLWPTQPDAALRPARDPPVPLAVGAGAGIGLLSGLTGTGGGIFLSPLLIFAAWCPPKASAGVAAAFILANSLAGLAGRGISLGGLPGSLPLYAAAVLAGALVGTQLSIRLPQGFLLKALGLVLLVAGLKLASNL